MLVWAVSALGQSGNPIKPTTPIQHLIVIVGENHTFDNLFATYEPKPGQTVMSLLAQRIVNRDGSPGANFSKAKRWQADDTEAYSIHPAHNSGYATLNQPNTNSAFGKEQHNIPDPRFPPNLPNGPFPITKYTAYQMAYTGDPV